MGMIFFFPPGVFPGFPLGRIKLMLKVSLGVFLAGGFRDFSEHSCMVSASLIRV